jgi:aminopeptidase N
LNESLVYNLQIEENQSSDDYVFDHPNAARRNLKNVALGISFVSFLDAFACMVLCTYVVHNLFFSVFECLIDYIASLADDNSTKLVLQQYNNATNMTDEFAAFTALAQNPGETRDHVLDDFYKRWQNEQLV